MQKKHRATEITEASENAASDSECTLACDQREASTNCPVLFRRNTIRDAARDRFIRLVHPLIPRRRILIQVLAMPINFSPEAEAKADLIPDISARLERFIHEQFELEQWRARRGHTDVADIVEAGLREGARLRNVGAERAALFVRLQALTEETSHVG